MSFIPNQTLRQMCRVAGRGARVTVQGRQIDAVFRNGYLEALGTETHIPQVTLPSADVDRLQLGRKGAELEVDGKPYRVQRHEADGTGMSRLLLES
jgi:hypothetical protein